MWGINNPKVITSTICANILRKEKINNFAALEEVLNTLALRLKVWLCGWTKA